MAMDKRKTYCPECFRIGLIYISDIVDDDSGYRCRCFCPYCTYVEKSWKKRTCVVRQKLPASACEQATKVLFEQRSSILRDLGVCNIPDPYHYNASLANIIGARHYQHRRLELLLPAHQSYNCCVGSVKLSRQGFSWPGKGSAVVLSDCYNPRVLIICSNPAAAMAVRYAVTEDGWNDRVGVIFFRPGVEIPPIELFQSAPDILAFSQDSQQREYLKKVLPGRAKLINSSLKIIPGHTAGHLKYCIENSLTLNEQRRLKAKFAMKKAG